MGCPAATVSGALPGASYQASWFDPRTGQWTGAATLEADRTGRIEMPAFPDGAPKSRVDWALKLTLSTRP